jgi:hypothetical protein
MQEKRDSSATDRRGFLRLAGIGAVASGVALVAGKDAAKAETVTTPKKGLYTESDHVKTYYRLARF